MGSRKDFALVMGMVAGDMGVVAIRDATRADYGIILALNLDEVAHTSPMDPARLAALDGLSCYHRVACLNDQVAGFLLAIRSGTPYENDNFAWFTRKYPSFVYVDRVVISAAARGQHIGSLLYADLFRWARQAGIPLVTCEYNIVPANEPSRLFHRKFGFREQGTQWVANHSKQVSLQSAETSPMDTSQATPSPDPTAAHRVTFRELISDAISYWEPRRLGYNVVLTVIVLGWVGLSWPHFRGAFAWPSVLAVFVLAVLANVCYCAAYLVDLAVQYSAYRETWRKRRWVLWLVGVAFAGALTYFWIADEIYPSVA